MHGAIWKLSALATVVGFGLLAVVLQQKGLGKGTGLATAKAEGTEPSEAPADGAPENGDGETSSESDTSPNDNGSGRPSSTSDENLARLDSDGADDEDAAFQSRRTAPRTTQARTGRRSRGDAIRIDELNAEENPDELNAPQSASRKSDAEGADESDAFDRLKSRPNRGRGPAPSTAGNQEEMDGDVVAQAPSPRSRSSHGFEDDTEPAERPAPRTSPRSAMSPRARPNRNPHAKLTEEGEDAQDAVAPTGARVVQNQAADAPRAPKGGMPFDASGDGEMGTSPRVKQRPNSALNEADDEVLPRQSRTPNESAQAEVPMTINDAGGSGATGEVSESAGDASGQQPFGEEELETTPAVPATRKRPKFGRDEESEANQPEAVPTNVPPQRLDQNAPQPIPKLTQPNGEDPELVPSETATESTRPRNGRRRPNSLLDEENGTADQPPATFPVAQKRSLENDDQPVESAPPVAKRNSRPEMNSEDTTGTRARNSERINPITGRPESSRHVIQVPNATRAPIDEEQQREAAASGNSATDVISPRVPVVPAPTPGSARGRARVAIEKIAPPTALLGQPLIYSIIIRNNGDAPAKQVVVEDDVPESVTMQGSIPQAEMTNRKLKWKIGNLEPGQEQKISVKVIPTAEGPVGSAATVNFVQDQRPIPAGVNQAADGRVSLELQYPPQVNIGEMFEVRFRLINRTNERLSDLMILTQLANSLQHESRDQNLEYKIEALAPREVLNVKLSLTASQTGNAISRASVMTRDETILESKDLSVEVRADAR